MGKLTGQENASLQQGKNVERVILGDEEAAIVKKWVDELNAKADGLIKFGKADVVNFLIANHEPDMSDVEVGVLSRKCYDEAKWLGWGLAKIKVAKKLGESLIFDDLVCFRDRLLGSNPRPISRKAKRKSAEMEPPEPETEENLE